MLNLSSLKVTSYSHTPSPFQKSRIRPWWCPESCSVFISIWHLFLFASFSIDSVGLWDQIVARLQEKLKHKKDTEDFADFRAFNNRSILQCYRGKFELLETCIQQISTKTKYVLLSIKNNQWRFRKVLEPHTWCFKTCCTNGVWWFVPKDVVFNYKFHFAMLLN